MGLWYVDTFRFRAGGWVTEAAGGGKHLVGWMMCEYGVTADANVEPVVISGMFVGFMPPRPAKWANLGHGGRRQHPGSSGDVGDGGTAGRGQSPPNCVSRGTQPQRTVSWVTAGVCSRFPPRSVAVYVTV